MSRLNQYLDRYADLPGFFQKEAMIAWEFLLDTQDRYPIHGHFLEIGVYEGKSATLGAMDLRPLEKAIRIDINPCKEGLQRVGEVKSEGVTFLQAPSYLAKRAEEIQKLAGQFRFIHIDGDHAGYSVANDLQLAADVIAEMGVICMDDFFNPIYPQTTATVYRFLFDNPATMRMVLCGANKCFLVKASAYRMYENLIRKYFVDHARGYSARLSLHKSSYTHDFGCFSMWTEHDRRPFGIEFGDGDRRVVGIDADQSDIVF
jgi:hypothetical protein